MSRIKLKLENGGIFVCIWARDTEHANDEEEALSLSKITPMPALNRIHLHSQLNFYDFHFDKVFHAVLSQEILYEACAKPLVAKVLDGSNCGLLRYGHKESENSFLIYEGYGPCQCGLAVRAFEDILANIGKGDKVDVSFVQIHNDQVFDLLAPTGRLSFVRRSFSRRRTKSLEMLVDEDDMDWLQPTFKHVDIADMESFLKVLKAGQASRATAASLSQTSVDKTHAALTFTLKRKWRPDLVRAESLKLASTRAHLTPARGFLDSKVVSSKLFVVDLGALEQSDTEEHMEIVAIGKCLKAKVEDINSLEAVQEAKLTKLLSPVLDEPGCVSLIVTIDTEDSKETESLRLLQFAQQGMHDDVIVASLSENLVPIGEEDELDIGDMEDILDQRSGPQGENEIMESSLEFPTRISASSLSQLDLDDEFISGELFKSSEFKKKVYTLGEQLEMAAEREKQEKAIEDLIERSKKKRRSRDLQIKEMETRLRAAREQVTKYHSLWDFVKKDLESTKVEARKRISQEIVARKQMEYTVQELAKNLRDAQADIAALTEAKELAKEENAIRLQQSDIELSQEKRKRIHAEGLLADYKAVQRNLSKESVSRASESAASQIEQLELEILELRKMLKEKREIEDLSGEEHSKELKELVHKFLVPGSTG